MNEYFGDPINDLLPLSFLLNNGWDEANGLLKRPDRPISDKEVDCACFLVDEWDYAIDGGLK